VKSRTRLSILVGLLVVPFAQASWATAPGTRSSEQASRLLQEEKSILDALDTYIFEARRAERALESASDARARTEERLALARDAMEKARLQADGAAIRLQETLRLARVTAPYRSQTAMVLGGEDRDLTRRGALLDRLAGRQAQELAVFEDAALAAMRAEFQAGIERANAWVLEVAEREARTRLETETAARRALLVRLEQDRSLNLRHSVEMGLAEKALVAEIEARLSSRPGPVQFESLRGQVRVPLAGGVVRIPFGDIIHPVFRTRTPHPGLTLAYDHVATRNIRAVAFGRVAWVGRMRGFGTTVVLDHASGYYTVYAGLDSVAVQPGAVVRDGHVIGIVARAPGESGVRLYFELRKGPDAMNPIPFFRREELGKGR
jgi:murein DD-endopeptidase MepM/ murein hydrolase activator NlpD